MSRDCLKCGRKMDMEINWLAWCCECGFRVASLKTNELRYKVDRVDRYWVIVPEGCLNILEGVEI